MDDMRGTEITPPAKTPDRVLSSEKREDLWAIIIAAAVLVLCCINPEAVHQFFKKSLFLF